jgi:ubiquinone biosynthesis protein COQ4
MAQSIPFPHYDLPRARRALAALMRDPDDLPQVFTLIESISGTALHRLFWRFKRTESGRRILRDQPDIVPRLADREALRALPAGSFGRAYLAFVESEGITAEGIVQASVEGQSKALRSEAFSYLRSRMRDTHDLWHAATGYKGDVLGELSLLAFTLGQNWNMGVALIVVTAYFKGLARSESRLILDGFRRGRSAAWLPAQEWESLLALPLEEVRARLELGAPATYTPIRTQQLRAQGRL